ncbi:MAG: hypothetical protein ABH883_07915, partial [Candidatus Omnitrophota bacterium]
GVEASVEDFKDPSKLFEWLEKNKRMIIKIAEEAYGYFNELEQHEKSAGTGNETAAPEKTLIINVIEHITNSFTSEESDKADKYEFKKPLKNLRDWALFFNLDVNTLDAQKIAELEQNIYIREKQDDAPRSVAEINKERNLRESYLCNLMNTLHNAPLQYLNWEVYFGDESDEAGTPLKEIVDEQTSDYKYGFHNLKMPDGNIISIEQNVFNKYVGNSVIREITKLDALRYQAATLNILSGGLQGSDFINVGNILHGIRQKPSERSGKDLMLGSIINLSIGEREWKSQINKGLTDLHMRQLPGNVALGVVAGDKEVEDAVTSTANRMNSRLKRIFGPQKEGEMDGRQIRTFKIFSVNNDDPSKADYDPDRHIIETIKDIIANGIGRSAEEIRALKGNLVVYMPDMDTLVSRRTNERFREFFIRTVKEKSEKVIPEGISAENAESQKKAREICRAVSDKINDGSIVLFNDNYSDGSDDNGDPRCTDIARRYIGMRHIVRIKAADSDEAYGNAFSALVKYLIDISEDGQAVREELKDVKDLGRLLDKFILRIVALDYNKILHYKRMHEEVSVSL